jgi:hypothetical protein
VWLQWQFADEVFHQAIGIHIKLKPEIALTVVAEQAWWNFHSLWNTGPFVYSNESSILSRFSRCLRDALAAILAASPSPQEYVAQKASKVLSFMAFEPLKSIWRQRDAMAMTYFLALSSAAMRSFKESCNPEV